MVVDAYIALGSNLGDRRRYLRDAIAAMDGRLGEVLALSPLYETEPVGGPAGQAWYFNMVLRLHTALSAHGLMDGLLAIEQEAGRVRTIKNGPRTLDLDLLLWDDLELSDERLTLPHPRMGDRRFVLEPLAQVHPNPKAIVGLDFERAWAQVRDQRVACRGPLAQPSKDVL